ncbi:hypothetical protein [Streptomyces sp. 6N106]|uniref:hypothetical protein n=1 Tax=Streptomyces sp. 6N106 TaxID=3457418 RepID=UPI003FD697F7
MSERPGCIKDGVRYYCGDNGTCMCNNLPHPAHGECPDNCPGCNAPGGVGDCGPDDRRDRCTCGETACESELCDCDSVPCPVDHAADYRREQYAAALYYADNENPDLWEYADPNVQDVYRKHADAAMAVADEELTNAVRVGSVLQAGQIVRLQEENARLRADVVDRGERLNKAHEESARLRDETAALRVTLAEADLRKHEMEQAVIRLRAQLEMLREVSRQQNARLREELDASERRYRSSVETYRDVTAAHARLRGELGEQADRHMASLRKVADLIPDEDEVARLRAELAEADENNRQRRIELSEARATIERVRAVCDRWDKYGTTTMKHYAAIVHEALAGPATVANPDRTQVDE